MTAALHFQVHSPSSTSFGRESLEKNSPGRWRPNSGFLLQHIDPVPAGSLIDEETLYPNEAHLTDFKEVRELYKMQRPAIAPEVRPPWLGVRILTCSTMMLVYPHDWSPKDLAPFHNRGVLHYLTG